MALIIWRCPNDLSGDEDFKSLVYREPHRSELEHNALDQVSNSVKSIPFCSVALASKSKHIATGRACSSIIVAACTKRNVRTECLS